MNPETERNSGLTTSAESLMESEKSAARLRQQIVALARKAGRRGLTINEAERLIDDHKGHSVSPRFAELVRLGLLVRVVVGRCRPTLRFPHGAPKYRTRFDEETLRCVIVHWVPEFAPVTEADEEKEPESVQ